MRAATRPAAFTLIELLIVISIILLLAALAVPVLSQAARQGRTARCVVNVKQMGAAFVQYANDHDGLLPNTYRYYTRSGALSDTPTWMQGKPRDMTNCPQAGQLWPYYRDAGLVLCPSDRDKGNLVFSYSGPVFISHRMLEQADNPSEALLVLGEHEEYHIGLPRNPGDMRSVEAGFGSIDRPAVRHGTKTPSGFFDGQARLVEYQWGFTAYDVEIPPWGFNTYYHRP